MKTKYLPVKEIKWEFYVKLSDFNRCMDGIRIEQEADRKYIEKLEEENRKQKLHIEAKDKAYTALLKDYEEIKEDRKKILDEIEAEIERFKAFRNR